MREKRGNGKTLKKTTRRKREEFGRTWKKGHVFFLLSGSCFRKWFRSEPEKTAPLPYEASELRKREETVSWSPTGVSQRYLKDRENWCLHQVELGLVCVVQSLGFVNEQWTHGYLVDIIGIIPIECWIYPHAAHSSGKYTFIGIPSKHV